MSKALSDSPAVPLPDDVIAFVAEHRVQVELPAVLEMTRWLFPHADLRVELDEDPEIAGDRHIVVRVKDGQLPVDQAVATRWQWHVGLFACCPPQLL
jgi:hypothetical protein